MKHKITNKNVPRETFVRAAELIGTHQSPLDLYIDRLLWWNQRLNLVSRGVSRETLEKHLLHSVLLSFIKPFEESSLIVDAGSGGGLPGIPLAICNPGKEFIINDIVSKKVLAVKQMARYIGLNNVRYSDESIEFLATEKDFLLVSKHAFKIDDLYNMCKNKVWTRLVFLKGSSFGDELKSIEEPLTILSWNLSKNSRDPFFDGKAIVVCSRK